MMRLSTAPAALAAALVIGASPLALAEGGLDGERFTPAAGAAGWLTAESPVVPYHLGWGLGLFLNVANDGLVVRDGDDVLLKPLDLAVSADVLASLGLWDVLEIGVHLPVRIVYDGEPIDVSTGTLEASAGVGDLPEERCLGVLEHVLPLEANVADRRRVLGGGAARARDSRGCEDDARPRADRPGSAPHGRHTKMPGMNLR